MPAFFNVLIKNAGTEIKVQISWFSSSLKLRGTGKVQIMQKIPVFLYIFIKNTGKL